ncbi:MAG: nucleotidyl transferase AbiEii/AbiGii toxin family protein [Candidatus Omnitrophica bacterium]|nr:nucleotidyl transferase AbiEii/AbiGii toxin family protein [Candidatus Omnitrophota bacterium]
MDTVAKMSLKEREELFRETEARDKRFNALIVEKDFWVCWILKILFEFPILSQVLIFKGGTSLSKAYNAIERFSEDIDLSISRKYLGFTGENDPANPDISGKKRKKILENLLPQKATEYICGSLRNKLEDYIGQTLIDSKSFSLEVALDDKDKQTLLFRYPASILPIQGLDYVRQYVRIELGIRSDQWPKEIVSITPYVAEQFPDVFTNSHYSLNCLSVNRTFWEKVTLLHSLYHKKSDKKLSERSSRHYYDIYMLLKQKERLNIDIDDIDLLDVVRKHKMLFYKSSWANYESAVRGSLKLVPPEFRHSEIAEDYRLTTRDLIYGNIPKLDDIIEELKDFENKFNH